MFGDAEKSIKISENAVLKIPDERTCGTCIQFEPNYTSHYEDNTMFYEITCGHRSTCKYIYDEAVVALDKKLEEAFNGELKEEKEGQ